MSLGVNVNEPLEHIVTVCGRRVACRKEWQRRDWSDGVGWKAPQPLLLHRQVGTLEHTGKKCGVMCASALVASLEAGKLNRRCLQKI